VDWNIPSDWTRVRTVDAHAEGEPLRVILDGFPLPEGTTVPERRRSARERTDWLRRALMFEPRGHADMYGCLVMPPVTQDAELSVLFLHNAGFSTMCGHGVIAVATVLLETGVRPAVTPETPLAIDTPAGLVRATAMVRNGRVEEVRFRNVPSFVLSLDAEVDVPGVGRVTYDLAYGGAFYAFVDAGEVGIRLEPDRVGRLIEAGRAIKRAVAERAPIEHPDDPDLGFLYGTIFTGPAKTAGRHSRHVCVFADGEVDRSPTGTGVSARLAILRARGEIEVDSEIEIESVIGSRFTGRVVDETRVGPHSAIVPEVGGRAFITGRHEFLLDPRDPWREGFLIR
jgi:proline racemase